MHNLSKVILIGIVIAAVITCGVIGPALADPSSEAIDEYLQELDQAATGPAMSLGQYLGWETYTNPDKATETGFVGFMPENLETVTAQEGVSSLSPDPNVTAEAVSSLEETGLQMSRETAGMEPAAFFDMGYISTSELVDGTSPGVVQRLPKHIDIYYARKSDNRIYTIAGYGYTGGTGWGTEFLPSSGYSIGSPAACNNGPNRVDVLYRDAGTGTRLFQMYWNGAWQPEHQIGTYTTGSAPGACYYYAALANWLAVVFRSGGGIYYIESSGGGTTWGPNPALEVVAPTGAMYDPEIVGTAGVSRLDVFFVDHDHQIGHKSWTGASGWSTITFLPMWAYGSPSAVMHYPYIDVFYQGSDGYQKHRRMDISGASFTYSPEDQTSVLIDDQNFTAVQRTFSRTNLFSRYITDIGLISWFEPAKLCTIKNAVWAVDYNGDHAWSGTTTDRAWTFGDATGTPIAGDWNGDGVRELGMYFPTGIWAVDWNNNHVWDGSGTDRAWTFGGQVGDIPFSGDFTGDDVDEIGVYRSGMWVVDWNGNHAWDSTPTDQVWFYGGAGHIPLVGDWDRNGYADIGCYLGGGLWALDKNGNHVWNGAPPDEAFYYGTPGWNPMVNDFDGDGYSEIAMYLNALWAVDMNDNRVWNGPPGDAVWTYGGTGDVARAAIYL